MIDFNRNCRKTHSFHFLLALLRNHEYTEHWNFCLDIDWNHQNAHNPFVLFETLDFVRNHGNARYRNILTDFIWNHGSARNGDSLLIRNRFFFCCCLISVETTEMSVIFIAFLSSVEIKKISNIAIFCLISDETTEMLLPFFFLFDFVRNRVNFRVLNTLFDFSWNQVNVRSLDCFLELSWNYENVRNRDFLLDIGWNHRNASNPFFCFIS